MAYNTNQTPDLQSILASLAQFTGAPAINADTFTAANGSEEPTGADAHTQYGGGVSSSMPSIVPEKVQDPRLRPQNRSKASPGPMIDPATITTWQEGLRCVTKIAAQNAHFAECIRKMMDDQQKHEMRWYAERQALKQTQAARSSSAAKAQSILASLNHGLSSEAPVNQTANAEKELAIFDRKIYAAQEAMEQAMTADLKGLGVPFFGTNQNLVIPEDHDMSKEEMSEDQPRWSRPVTESEILALRRRMVEHLEDMYKD